MKDIIISAIDQAEAIHSLNRMAIFYLVASSEDVIIISVPAEDYDLVVDDFQAAGILDGEDSNYEVTIKQIGTVLETHRVSADDAADAIGQVEADFWTRTNERDIADPVTHNTVVSFEARRVVR